MFNLTSKYFSSNINRIVISLVIILNFLACSTAPKITTIDLPKLPYVEPVDFIPPNHSYVKFIPLNGNNSITKNNVTVKVNSVERNNTYSTKINDPFKHLDYPVSISPMAVLIEITNNTDHIITLRKTIVRIEDKNQKEYPLINSISASKKLLVDKIDIAYDEHLDKVHANLMGALFSQEYERNYKRFVKKFDDAAKLGEVRLPTTEEGFSLKTTGETIKDTRAPAYLLKLNYNPNLKKISNAKIKAREQVLKINETLGKVITGGVYQPINILPQRSVKITAPFYFDGEIDEIDFLNVGIYDLPTEVDQAGNPTKRDHFVFEMTTSSEISDRSSNKINGDEYQLVKPGISGIFRHSLSLNWVEKSSMEDSFKVEPETTIDGNNLLPINIIRKQKDKKDENIIVYSQKTGKGYVYFGSKNLSTNNESNIELSNIDTPTLPSKTLLNVPFKKVFNLGTYGFKNIGRVSIDSIAKKCKKPPEISIGNSNDCIKVVSYKKIKQGKLELYLFSEVIYLKNFGELKESTYLMFNNKVMRLITERVK